MGANILGRSVRLPAGLNAEVLELKPHLIIEEIRVASE
jgi:hypothetical protein